MENQARARTDLLKDAREASQTPGVYLMRDGTGVILYVGKAKNLKNRLVTYFQGEIHEFPRIELMVRQVSKFDVILTETEAEALILEATLIKKHKPRFNIRLKDDKAYPYLKIRVAEPYPRIEWTRKVYRDGARYFGPFPSAWSARQVLTLLNETFRLRDCADNTFRHRSRACILHQMGKCTAPCVAKISEADYREVIGQVTDVLEGKGTELTDSLRSAMDEAAEHEEYELAAEYRDQLKSLEVVTATQVVDEAGTDRHRDIVGLARKDASAHAVVLQVRHGRMIGVRHYHLQNTDSSQANAELLQQFLEQYYVLSEREAEQAERESAPMPTGTVPAPSEVLLPEAPEDPELLEKSLSMGIRVPESDIDRQFANVARINAEHALEQATKRGGGHGIRALEEVQEKLELQRLPARIECYDISNTQGEDSVASRVVFINGAPDKNLYRRYKIKTVVGSNDFAMMREVLDRRFSPKGSGDEAMPDLVVVDGGKGQLSQAVAILEELSVQGVGVVGLAKARTESDFKSKEVVSSNERIFIPGRKNPVLLHPHQGAYKLLVHVRDEAHRFAISYHRRLRGKRSLKSEIDES